MDSVLAWQRVRSRLEPTGLTVMGTAPVTRHRATRVMDTTVQATIADPATTVTTEQKSPENPGFFFTFRAGS